jgi:hypothetical protein
MRKGDNEVLSLFYLLIGTKDETAFNQDPFVTFEERYEIRKEDEGYYWIIDDSGEFNRLSKNPEEESYYGNWFALIKR